MVMRVYELNGRKRKWREGNQPEGAVLVVPARAKPAPKNKARKAPANKVGVAGESKGSVPGSGRPAAADK